MFLLLSLATAMAQGTTQCTSTDGSELTYQTWRYQGGPYPAPGMVVGRESWTLGDTALYVRINRSESPSETTGALTWTWEAQTPGVVEPTAVQAMGQGSAHTYTTRVTLSVPEGAPPIPGLPTAPVPMKCEQYSPPPMP